MRSARRARPARRSGRRGAAPPRGPSRHTSYSTAAAGGPGSGSASGSATASSPSKSALSHATPSSTTEGWVRRAAATTSGASASVSYGQTSQNAGVGEREVEQGLVAVALDELRGAALRMDRLADPAQGAARAAVGGHEVPPGRDDARRVRADVGHVGEQDVVGIAAERVAQRLDLGRADDDERRLAGRDAVAEERAHPGDERVAPGVHERLVTEGPGEPGVLVRQGHGVSRPGRGARSFPRNLARERSSGGPPSVAPRGWNPKRRAAAGLSSAA